MAVPSPSQRIAAPTDRLFGWRDWALVLLTGLLALPIAAILPLGDAWLTIACAVPGVIALQLVVQRRGGWRLIGPHGYYDLIRMARKGRTVLFRVLFLLALLGGIWYTYHYHRPGRSMLDDNHGIAIHFEPHRPPNLAEVRNRLAQFNSDCVCVWFLLQNLTILLLTPAYVGGAIAEERERGTLDLLFTTGLRNREIVLGKLMACLLHLGAFLLAGLPVFSMMLVWGGIDVPFLIAQWVNSALLLLATASACLLFSTMPVRTSTCVITSYAVVLPTGLCCSSGWQGALQSAFLNGAGLATPDLLVLFAITYGLAVPGCILLAIHALRPPDWPPPAVFGLPPPRATPRAEQRDRDEPIVPPMLPISAAANALEAEPWHPQVPRVRDGGLLWKECHTGGRSIWHVPEVLLFGGMIVGTVVFILLVVSVAEITHGGSGPDSSAKLRNLERIWGDLLRVSLGACGGCYAVGVAFRAAGCVVRERQAHTLDLLLMIPCGRHEILRAKACGVLFKGWPWLVVISVNLVFGTVIGAYQPLALVYLLLAALPLVLVLCPIGILISVIARTPLHANVPMAGTLILLAGCISQTPSILAIGINALTRSAWIGDGVEIDGLPMRCFGAAGMLLFGTIAWVLARVVFNRTGP